MFARRSGRKEWMDDLSIEDERLYRGLHDLRVINRWLGGYSAVWSAVKPYLAERPGRTVRILDIGTGIADIPEYLIRRADRMGRRVNVTGVDVNAATIEYARDWLEQTLPSEQLAQIELVVSDLFSLPFDESSFDLCTASLFLHHLEDRDAIRALELLDRLSVDGWVVSDLHRTPLAYYGLRCINRLLPVSEMVQHDGPLSILRGFRKRELERMVRAAGCARYSIEWHWAFRWIVSTINV